MNSLIFSLPKRFGICCLFSLTLAVPDFYTDLGKQYNIPVETKIIAELERTPAYKSDYIHFNKEGYKALAEALVRFLKEQGALA